MVKDSKAPHHHHHQEGEEEVKVGEEEGGQEGEEVEEEVKAGEDDEGECARRTLPSQLLRGDAHLQGRCPRKTTNKLISVHWVGGLWGGRNGGGGRGRGGGGGISSRAISHRGFQTESQRSGLKNKVSRKAERKKRQQPAAPAGLRPGGHQNI